MNGKIISKIGSRRKKKTSSKWKDVFCFLFKQPEKKNDDSYRCDDGDNEKNFNDVMIRGYCR